MYYVPTLYLIRESNGALIEPGSATIPHIQEVMAYLGMKDLSCIISTHIHLDHGSGAGVLAQLFP
jgi:glyoxylase-like metal-dependent hydrolase (beta-lactamase superfamily II)